MPEDNPERWRLVRYVSRGTRAEMLAEPCVIDSVLPGTHGKTTTTSLIAAILGEAGEDPTFVAVYFNQTGANALGEGDYWW